MGSVLILGEHDKGLGEPFSIKTVSGRRLRAFLTECGLRAELGNVYDFQDNRCVQRDLVAVCAGFTSVVAVGRVAEEECRRQGISASYLPHPAVRSTKQLANLRAGLAQLKFT